MKSGIQGRLRSLVPKHVRRSITAKVEEWRLYRPYFAAIRGKSANAASIIRYVRNSYRPVDGALIMISQVERSGGSLMAQLFDGHPQILAHPHELKIGYPRKDVWPRTDLSSAESQFRILYELDNLTFVEEGYAKSPFDDRSQSLFILPELQFKIFKDAFEKCEARKPRDVLNAYFTSYFNAWLNYRGHIEQARAVTAFVPMMSADKENMDQFWDIYPDGKLISIIRSPLSWYASYARLKGGALPDLAARWNRSVEAMFRERERCRERTIFLSFEDLVGNTEQTMRLICSRIGIDFHPSLTKATFNSEPIASNSAFGRTSPGQVTDIPIDRSDMLSAEELAYLNTHCMPLYARALEQLIEKV